MSPAKKLRRAAATAVCLALSTYSFSQSASIVYHEISPVPDADSASVFITYIMAIRNPESLDTLSLKLSNAADETVYAAANTVAGWTAAHPYRYEDGILYLTVAVANSLDLGEYSMSARLKSGTDEIYFVKP